MNKKSLEVIDATDWKSSFSSEVQQQAINALENGKILYFPHLQFSLNKDEEIFLSPEIVDPKVKNVSYDIHRNRLGKVRCGEKEAKHLQDLMHRYALTSRQFFDSLIPYYKSSLIQARTSFRPVEVSGRKSSYRKDDTRLHVDAFPSTPVKGQRILRFFSNVNPDGKPRVWRAGEPFEDVVKKMASRLPSPVWGSARLMKILGITKDLRTEYDHYMLKLHDAMKKDMYYQQTVLQEELQFPPGSSWAVFTDQVSHAAMGGQHLFEQSFYLPAKSIKNQETNPLNILEKTFKRKLV